MTKKSLVLLATVLATCLPPSRAQTSSPSADIAVVVNPANPVTNITLVDLRKIFSGEKRSWPSHMSVKLIVRAPGSHERAVLLKLLNMSESDYKQYWTVQVFRGEAESAPFDSPSLGMVMEAINSFPGAISFVDINDVKPKMKIIKVEGLMPSMSGYPLH